MCEKGDLMVYFRLTKKLCSNRKLFQGISVVLIATVFWVILFGSSIVKYRYRYYEPFRSDLNGKGISCGADYVQISKNGSDTFVIDRSQIKKNLKDIKEVYASYQLGRMYNQYHTISAWSYDPELIEKYTPKLKEGKWLDPDHVDGDAMEAVVYNTTGDIHCGDTVTLSEDHYGYTLKVKVIGLLDKDALVYGYNGNISNDKTVHSFYVSPEVLINNGPYRQEDEQKSDYMPDIYFFNNENLSNNKLFSDEAGGDGTGIQRVMSGVVNIVYKDSITKQTIDENNKKICNSMMYQKVSLKERKDASVKYIFAQLNLLLPLGICIFILLLIALLSYEALNFTNQLKALAVLFICGMKWKKSVLICLFHNFIIHMIACALFAVSYFIVKIRYSTQMEFCSLNTICILLILFIMVVDHILSIIIPLIMLKNKQPKSILYNN